MKRLSKEQVILLHKRLIEATGGSDGIRDNGMLDSALSNPFQSFGDENCIQVYRQKQRSFVLELSRIILW